mgnify:CR=1 FL=1
MNKAGRQALGLLSVAAEALRGYGPSVSEGETGLLTKAAHALGQSLPHVRKAACRPTLCVVAIAMTRDDRMLLGKRVSDDDGDAQWVPPGGKVEEGEALAEALYREVREETGCRLRSADFAFTQEWIERDYRDDCGRDGASRMGRHTEAYYDNDDPCLYCGLSAGVKSHRVRLVYACLVDESSQLKPGEGMSEVGFFTTDQMREMPLSDRLRDMMVTAAQIEHFTIADVPVEQVDPDDVDDRSDPTKTHEALAAIGAKMGMESGLAEAALDPDVDEQVFDEEVIADELTGTQKVIYDEALEAMIEAEREDEAPAPLPGNTLDAAPLDISDAYRGGGGSDDSQQAD